MSIITSIITFIPAIVIGFFQGLKEAAQENKEVGQKKQEIDKAYTLDKDTKKQEKELTKELNKETKQEEKRREKREKKLAKAKKREQIEKTFDKKKTQIMV